MFPSLYISTPNFSKLRVIIPLRKNVYDVRLCMIICVAVRMHISEGYIGCDSKKKKKKRKCVAFKDLSLTELENDCTHCLCAKK